MHNFLKSVNDLWNANCLIQVWTSVTGAISYDGNHYTTSTHIKKERKSLLII